MIGQNQLPFDMLPQCYGENKLTLLVKDPDTLFAYWELAGEREEAFVGQFGRELWEKSIPVLKVINLTYCHSFYININNSANSWYISIDKPGSTYAAELGRRLPNDLFVFMASSKYVRVPANAESRNTSAYFTDYRWVKNGNAASGAKFNQTVMTERERDLLTFLGESSKTGRQPERSENLYGLSRPELSGERPVFTEAPYKTHG